MSTASATVTNLRIEEQNLAFTVAVDGDPGGTGAAWMAIYDAGGTEQGRTDLGQLEVGQTWEGHTPLPVWTLDDGDYGVWVMVNTTTSAGESGGSAQAGISFLIGRHRAFPSREVADSPQFDDPPELSPLRLEGTWVVFDMKNKQAFDVEVHHTFSITPVDGGDQHLNEGEELVRAGATQQGHYLLPDGLSEGRHEMLVVANVQGSDYKGVQMATVQVDGDVLTLVS